MADTTVWQAYAMGDEQARESLLTRHLSLVHHIARRLYRRLATDLEFDELVSAGTMGLLDAMDRFDPARGLSFATYAVPRIHGAMLDELRRFDHIPSSLRRRSSALGAARSAVTNRIGRTPTSNELAEHLGIGVETLWQWQTDAQSANRIELDAPAEYGPDAYVTHRDVLVAEEDANVEERLTRDQEIEILRDAVLHRLTARERMVLTLCYFEELRLQDVAKVLEVSESRVCQIRTGAIAKLRRELKPLRARVA